MGADAGGWLWLRRSGPGLCPSILRAQASLLFYPSSGPAGLPKLPAPSGTSHLFNYPPALWATTFAAAALAAAAAAACLAVTWRVTAALAAALPAGWPPLLAALAAVWCAASWRECSRPVALGPAGDGGGGGSGGEKGGAPSPLPAAKAEPLAREAGTIKAAVPGRRAG